MNLSGFLAALGEPNRLELVKQLRSGELCVCDLQHALKTHQPKVSRHLAYLRRAGLVDTRRDGRWIYYRLKSLDSRFQKLLDDVLACSTHQPSDRAPGTPKRKPHLQRKQIAEDLTASAEEDPMLFD